MITKIVKLISAVVLVGYSILSGKAQDTAYVGVRTLVRENTVLLRWATSSAAAWKHVNKYGFDIERETVTRDGKVLAVPEIKKTNHSPVKPKPLDEWENIAKTDDYAAVVAQAIYGEDFDLSSSSPISRIVSASQQLDQRFSVSLYAADNSFEAALMAGWGWRDADITPGERYLYRIIPIMPENSALRIETGIAFVAPDEPQELPRPIGLVGVFDDRSVLLAWDYASTNDIYNSYYLEKSTDSINYSRFEGIPITNFNNSDDKTSQRMYFADSLQNNSQKYYYRIVGVTPFGETGPPSLPVSGHGIEVLEYVPHISVAEINFAGDLDLEWEFDERGNPLIERFELSRSDNSVEYETVVADIKPERRTLRFPKEKLSPSNYFTVTAIPRSGVSTSSFPVLVQPVDSVPPAVPAGFTGRIDTSGIVTLTWEKNGERDLLGYKIYRSNLKNEEPIPLFDTALRDTVYQDVTDVRNLNRKAYYAVASLDMRYNQSDRTPMLELEKPDLVPPSSPVLSGYKIADDGIEVEWVNSSDPDVAEHRVWRNEKGEGYRPKTLLAVVRDASVTKYLDTSAVANMQYFYTVTAMKSNLLESAPSVGLTLFTDKTGRKNTEIDRFDAIIDRGNNILKLNWADKLKDVSRYEIYKSTGDEKPTLWKTATADRREVIEDNLQTVGALYLYIIRAVFISGENSKSKTLEIKL